MGRSGAWPDFRGPMVQIVDHDDPARSETTLLVAALLTLGIPRVVLAHTTFEPIRGGHEWRTVHTLRDESPCKRFRAPALIPLWDSHPWHLANPAHPFAILRTGLSVAKLTQYTPRFTVAELAAIETPDTWLEAGLRNLVVLLREIPAIVPQGIVRFGDTHLAAVPKNLIGTKRETRFLNYVEHPSKRSQILAA